MMHDNVVIKVYLKDLAEASFLLSRDETDSQEKPTANVLLVIQTSF